MEIKFRTKRIAKLLNTRKALVQKYGDKRAKVIQRRLLDIAAAETLADLYRVQAAGLHPLKADKKGLFAVKAGGPLRLLLCPIPSPVPRAPSGREMSEEISSVWVEGVEDYHRG